MQFAQALDRRPCLQMYTVPGNCMPLGPDKLEVAACSYYLGAAGGCELLTNMWEKCVEEVQGADTSSLIRAPLFQDTWQCVQLLFLERNASCQ